MTSSSLAKHGIDCICCPRDDGSDADRWDHWDLGADDPYLAGGFDPVEDPQPSVDDQAGITWWNSLSESDRLYWLGLANSASPVDAWNWFKRVRPHEALDLLRSDPLPLIDVEHLESSALDTGDEVANLLNSVFGPESPISGTSRPHPWVESQNDLKRPESAILELVEGLPHGVVDGLDDDRGVRTVFRGLAAGDGDGAGNAASVSLIELVAEAFIGGFFAGVREGASGARSTHSNGGPLSHRETNRSFLDQSRGL